MKTWVTGRLGDYDAVDGFWPSDAEFTQVCEMIKAIDDTGNPATVKLETDEYGDLVVMWEVLVDE